MMRPSRQQHSASPHPSPQKATASSAAFAAVSSPHAPAGRQPGVDDKENLDCSLLPSLLPTPETIDKHPAGHPAVASRAAKRSRVQGKLALAAAARSMLTFFRFLLFITIKYLRIFSIFVVYNYKIVCRAFESRVGWFDIFSIFVVYNCKIVCRAFESRVGCCLLYTSPSPRD